MSSLALAAVTFLAAYLVGGIPFGYLVAKARGVDIFQQGSGNIGATNVGRVLGRRFGILVFILDFLKGALPVLGAAALAGFALESNEAVSWSDPLRVGAGLSAILGHMFPVYLRFKGGKGVATGTGVVAVLLPLETLGALLVWATVVLATRYVSLASLSAAAALCLGRLLLKEGPVNEENRVLTLFCLVAAALVWVRHRANLGRLLKGTENRLQESVTMLQLAKLIHVLALGLWFGSIVFFSFIAAPLLFRAFESEASKPAGERALWLPLPREFDRDLETRKEQGTRAAGVGVSPLFDWFFPLQGVCGLLAVATALSFAGPPEWAHKTRVIVLIAGLVTVVVGWPMERKIHDLRLTRIQTRDAVLKHAEPVPAELQQAAADARGEFGTWHTCSLFLNFLTILLVTVAMGLAAWLPADPAAEPPAPTSAIQSAAAAAASDQTIVHQPIETKR